MKRNKLILLMVLVFCAGFAGGVVTTRFVVRRIIRVAIEQPDRARDGIERQISRRLQLDIAQRAKLHEEMGKAHERLRMLRQEFQPRMAEIVIELRDRMKPSLTPEQQRRLEDLQQENQGLFRR